MAGIIPNNKDPQQAIALVDDLFWDKVLGWEKKGWAIALHGYNHCYTSNCGLKGLNPFLFFSEFAGLPIDEQRFKIRNGISIMKEHGINPKYFFAPGHTFDENTLIALREESSIRVISDTIALRPYRYKDFVLIPQFSGHCRKMWWDGIYTFCFHPNTMPDSAFKNLDSFLGTNKESFIAWQQLDFSDLHEKSFIDKAMSWFYFSYRRIRGLR